MDIWEDLLDTYANFKDIDNFRKALTTAQKLLATDLTVFEKEWFVSTLLYQPVLLLDIVDQQRGDPVWTDCLVDALTLLSNLLQIYNGLHKYYHEIVQVCSAVPDGACRTTALTCLLYVSRHSTVPANHLQRLLAALDGPARTPSRGPLALLIGSICRSLPQVVENQAERIWRVFLRLLDDVQLSGAARAAGLEGASGILAACGAELPTADLLAFYNLLRAAALHPRCHTACMRILWCHVALFSEQACEDAVLRTRLWEHGSDAAYRGLTAIYRQMVRTERLHKVVVAEAIARVTSKGPARLTALRALNEAHRVMPTTTPPPLNYIHISELESTLWSDHIDNDDVSLIALCIEIGVDGSSELVSAWVKRSTSLPGNGDQLLARAALASPPYLRQLVIRIIVIESCDTAGFDRCVTLCQHLFDLCLPNVEQNESSEEFDSIPLSDMRAGLLDALVANVLYVVAFHSAQCNPWKEDGCKALIGLNALVCVALKGGGAESAVAGAKLVDALSSCTLHHPTAVSAALTAALAAPLAPPTSELKMLRVEAINDAEVQWQCCEAVCGNAMAPPQYLADFTLAAAEIVLSSGRASATLLLACVRTLAALVSECRDNVDEHLLAQVCRRVSELRARRFARSRTERELQREILLFLGQCPLSQAVIMGEQDWTTACQAAILEVKAGTGSIRLGCMSTLWAAALGPSPQREQAQELVDWLAELLRDATPAVTPPLTTLVWWARAGADLLPFAPVLPQRALPEFFQIVECESSVVARNALAALATAALTALPADGRETQLRTLLAADQKATPEGRIEMLAVAAHTARSDGVELRKEILKALAAHGAIHRGISLLAATPSVPSTVLLAALLAVPDTNSLSDRIALQSIASQTDCLTLTDIVVEAIDDSYNFGRLLSVLNKVSEISSDSGLSNRICTAMDSLIPKRLFGVDVPGSQIATFQFIALNAPMLLEINYAATISSICSLIEGVKVDQTRALRSHLANCVQRVTKAGVNVEQFYSAGERWARKQCLSDVTEELRRRDFTSEKWMLVKAVRDIMVAIGVTSALGDEAVNWANMVRQIYENGLAGSDSHQLYLIDVLYVALPALSMHQLEALFKDASEFCGWAAPALAYLVQCKDGVDLLLKILKHNQLSVLLPRMFSANAPALVNRLWEMFESVSTFEEQMLVATEIQSADKIGCWAEKIALNPDTPPLRMLRLLPLLPSTMQHRVAASALATAGVTGAGGATAAKVGVAVAAVRTLLAAPPCLELVDIISTLADDDSECEWFEMALSRWARIAATDGSASGLLIRLHEFCWEARTLGVCLRLVVPMLRFANPALVEDMISQWCPRLIGALRVKPRTGGDQRALRRCLLDYVRALTLLTIAFERVPRAHHERPETPLNRTLDPLSQPFQLVRTVCSLCVALRESVRTLAPCDDKLQDLCRVFECANFVCLSAALFCRQGATAAYRAILNDNVWERLVQPNVSLPLTTWDRSKPTSVPSVTSSTSSIHSRVFLTTLTDDPLYYDLHEELGQTETSEKTEGHRKVEWIWPHECAGTLAVLLRHAVRALPPDLYLPPIRSALSTTRLATLRWLLAQCVCSEQSLSDTLRDELLDVILDTLQGGLLNRLHLHVLSVVAPTPLDSTRANRLICALVLTAIEQGTRSLRLINDVLERWLRAHSDLVLPDSCYNQYVTESGWKKWSCMSVMRRVSACGVRVSKLPETLASAAEAAAGDARTLRSIGATMGSVLLAEANNVRTVEKIRRSVLAVRSETGVSAYLTLLAAVAPVYPALVDAEQARIVTDMLTKIIGRDKQKCLRILCAFINQSNDKNNEQIADIFDLVEPMVSLTCDSLIIELCTAAIKNAREAARNRVVAVAVDLAASTTLTEPALHRAANLLLFAEIARRVKTERDGNKEGEPQTKRRAGCNSLILSSWEDDKCWRHVLSRAVTALDHRDANIVERAVQGLCATLSDDHYTRLSEIIVLGSPKLGSKYAPGFDVALRLFMKPEIQEQNSERESQESRVLDVLLSMAQGSEVITCALAGAVVQSAHGTATERERLLDILIESLKDSRTPALLEMLHHLVPAGRQLEFNGTKPSDPLLRELRHRAKLTPDDHFTLGHNLKERCTHTLDTSKFSVQAMSECFGWLSEWERWGEWNSRDMPQLWTDIECFRQAMETYSGECSWLRAMWAESGADVERKGEMGLYRLLLAADRWPREPFTLSVIWEVEMWKESALVRDSWKGRHVCLAQTAARLMIRWIHSLSSEEKCGLHTTALREDIISWCSLANNIRGGTVSLRTALHQDVIRACSQLELYEPSEYRCGMEQLAARRALAVYSKDRSQLAEILVLAEDNWRKMSASSRDLPVEALRLMRLVLQLRADTYDVSRIEVEEAMASVKRSSSSSGHRERCALLATVTEHLDCLFERTTELEEKCDILNGIYEIVELTGEVNGNPYVDLFLACLLRLQPEHRPQSLLDKLGGASKFLEEYQREVIEECGVSTVHTDRDAWAARLALVRDPQHALLYSCALLMRAAAAEDVERWREALGRGRQIHPDAFVDFPDEMSEDAVRILKAVQKAAQAQLDARGNGTLRLSTLSPALSVATTESKTLAELLDLPPHARLHRFEERVEVFADSARRPCVLRARLTDGSTRRWLVKGGESPRPDRAAMAIARGLRRLHPVRAQHIITYNVQALSEDCSLIEFLEDRERLDSLAGATTGRPSALGVREAVRKRSITGQHFLDQQRRFTETLAASTLLTALLGVGDRHPQNVLVCRITGALGHVDWASAPRHDALSREPPPARLTRNMLALATSALESLVLEWGEIVREHAAQVVATIRVVYRYLPDVQLYKVAMMEQQVRGQRTSHQLALQQLQQQQRRQQQQRSGSLEVVLADVFRDFPDKENYSVEEQVSSLLRMSTEPRILALTRPAWQPYL